STGCTGQTSGKQRLFRW
ncbi:glutathione S-transferase, N-terminal domain protein, partial [Vibrio parahaemolyticus EKP-028]